MYALRQMDGTSIARLRVKASLVDPLPARLRVASLLSGADLQPPGMPPCAILVVRSISDPLPGSVALHGHSARVDPIWERAVQNALADVSREAARPARGYVPASAEAVLFTDEGEMLACLALDVAEGRAAGCWWWRSLLPTMPSPSAHGLCRVLCDRPVSVPAALHHLAVWGRAGAVVEALPSTHAMAVLSAVMRAHGLSDFSLDAPDLLPVYNVASALKASLPSDEPGSAAADLGPPPVAEIRGRPPWERLVPSGLVPRISAREHSCLLGVALALHHAPAAVRGHTFARELRAWWAEATRLPKPGAGGSGRAVAAVEYPLPPAVGAELLAPLPENASATTELAPQQPPDPVPDLAQATPDEVSHPGPESRSASIDASAGRGLPHRAGPSPTESRSPPAEISSVSFIESGELPLPPPVQHPDPEAAEMPAPAHGSSPPAIEEQMESLAQSSQVARQEFRLLLEGGVDTQLGGLLYLINLMCRLDLPVCFEEEWGLATQVGPWGVLEALGRALLERNAEAVSEDPLWAALATLSGREPGTLPGETFAGEADFRLPAGWLPDETDRTSNTYAWAVSKGRLRLWSDQGYIVLDCSADLLDPKAQALDALRAYGRTGRLRRRPFGRAPVASFTSSLLAGLNPHLARWLAPVIPYIGTRLCRALGIEPGKASDLEKTLLLRCGRLYVTSTHVDLVMSLDAISIPLRVAGLDRDPGWLPDFGRVVKFHFE